MTVMPEAYAPADGIDQNGLEQRAECDSLEALHAERRALLDANGELLALYGPFGHYDDHRKAMAEAQKITARLSMAGREKKPTEAEIDATAYGSDEYQKFLDNALDEKVIALKVQNQITEIEERIRSRELALLAYNKELGLAR